MKLNRLGGAEWQKAKSRVRSAVKDIAKELIQLYAKRMQIKGHAFSQDTEWQHDFESHFEFEETEDQLRCIAEIKKRHGARNAHGPPAVRRRGLRQDGGGAAGRLQNACRTASSVPFSCPPPSSRGSITRPSCAAWRASPVKVEILSRFRTPKQQEDILRRPAPRRDRHRRRHAPAREQGRRVPATSASSSSTRNSGSAWHRRSGSRACMRTWTSSRSPPPRSRAR